jgi:hypothetical protein
MTRRRKGVAEKISLSSLEASITVYYDNLTDAAVEEDKIWREFAGRELVPYIRDAIPVLGRVVTGIVERLAR